MGLHGLIHLIGFLNAFFSTTIEKQVLGISKPIGSLWLTTFILFVISIAQYLDNKKWFYIAFIAVLISQILIITAWRDAKFGSVANIIILLVSMSAYGMHRFHKIVKNESAKLFQNIGTLNKSVITENDIAHLPKLVQKWITRSGAVGHHNVVSVRLKQKGEMRTKPNSRWMPFTANQYFNVNNPSFVWCTHVDAMPILPTVGCDKLVNGKGEMLINLAGLIPVINESKNEKINQGAMLRYLAEMCWFPTAALKNYVQWETIDATSVKATLTIKGKSVSGIFNFAKNGTLSSFEANRYYGGGKDSKLEKWKIENIEYKVFNNVEIPYKSKVIWKIEDQDFQWLRLEILDIEYNTQDIY
jgi:hypothetical protein